MKFQATNIKNLFKWEGWKAEFPWILFVFFIAFAAYGYKSDIDQCRIMMKNPCYQQCRLEEIIKQLQQEYPGVQIQCHIDNLTNTYKCDFSGDAGDVPFGDDIKETLKRINNMSLVPS